MMSMSRCYSFMKCLLILFSIVLVVVGCGAVSLSVWALYEGGGLNTAGSSELVSGACAVGAWGLALAGGGALAGAGAASGTGGGSLAAGAALLAVAASAEAATAWWGAAHLPQLKARLINRLTYSVQHEYGVVPATTKIIEAIQIGLQCCGANGPRDYQNSEWSRRMLAETTQRNVPEGEGTVLDLSLLSPRPYFLTPGSCYGEAYSGTEKVAIIEEPPTFPGCGHSLADYVVGGGGGGAGAAAAAAAFLLVHGISLLLAIALCVRPQTNNAYKA